MWFGCSITSMPLLRFRLPSGRLVTITSCLTVQHRLHWFLFVEVMLLGIQTDRNPRHIPVKAGVLDNIPDTFSFTDVDTSLSELRIRMSSSSTSPASFGFLLSSSLPHDYNLHGLLRNLWGYSIFSLPISHPVVSMQGVNVLHHIVT